MAPDDFDALFRTGYPRLVATVTFVCGDREVAAECVADAFERAYVRWRRVGRLDDPLGWVRRVAINRATDVHRRSSRGRRALARLGGRAELRRTGEVGLTDAAALRDSGLAAAVADLSPQQRAVVALHYLDDLSVAAVAEAMDLSEGAVKYHLHQARGRLRALLGADAAGPADEPTEEGRAR
ncbi:RNA polymerase sigma factor [Dermatobacter hominis]|uniref:RNA polymerase sigma factor n=1 Tax=Dermatobacter hominis TaxID=2884263 RepID=UPI001D105B2C|nr:sigma-70 family RNA polymerase sigma factor [Dermatobacter hominis]UDY35233.1 sigma-70 family RNA polymerase sigma factor [Dermatobacter hominis]